jgi:tRNA threonylcarbamoyladenosine biosynthesis protein TsaE
MAFKIISKSSSETKKIGELLAKTLFGGEIIGLIGDLGGGKTTFIQGLALGLKIKEQISSPTFVVFKKYRVSSHKKIKWLQHFDLYRIKNAEELLDLGFDEIINQTNSVSVIEWADRVFEILPKNYLKISFRYIGKNSREIIFSSDLLNDIKS